MHEVWPVVFVVEASVVEDALAVLKAGRLKASKIYGGHVRANAKFVCLTKGGQLLASGQVTTAKWAEFQLDVAAVVSGPDRGPSLDRSLLDRLNRAVGKKTLKSVSAFPVRTDGKDLVLDVAWFDAVAALPLDGVQEAVAQTAATPTAVVEVAKPTPPPTEEARPVAGPLRKVQLIGPIAPGDLAGWIPPALAGLLEDWVQAAEWEPLVAAAFRALGATTEERGRTRPGEAVADCIVRFTGPKFGDHILVVDAKAGAWNGRLDDTRAMKDYISEFPGERSYAVFVAASFTPGTKERLREAEIPHKVPLAITGRDLARLIAKRLTTPEFQLEAEFRRVVVG